MNLCSLRCNPTLPSVVKSDVGCLDTSDVGCLIRVCVPCHFDQMRAAPVVQRSALRTGRCCCWPSQMGKCSKAGSNRDAPRLCDKGLCGTCCQQQCSEKALGIEVQLEGVQESLRNSNGILLGGAIKFVKECMQHPGAAKFMEIEKIPRHTVFDAIFKMMVQEFRKTPPSCSRASAPTAEGPVGHFVVHPHPKRLQHASNISFFVIIAICDARCFSPCQH